MILRNTLSIIVVIFGFTLPNILISAHNAAGVPAAAGGAGGGTERDDTAGDDTVDPMVPTLLGEIEDALLGTVGSSPLDAERLSEKVYDRLNKSRPSSLHFIKLLTQLANGLQEQGLEFPAQARAKYTEEPFASFAPLQELYISIVQCFNNKITEVEGVLLRKKTAVSPDKDPQSVRDAAFKRFCDAMDTSWKKE